MLANHTAQCITDFTKDSRITRKISDFTRDFKHSVRVADPSVRDFPSDFKISEFLPDFSVICDFHSDFNDFRGPAHAWLDKTLISDLQLISS